MSEETSLEHRIGVGSRVYHMTNESNWKQICRDGFLKPNSVLPKVDDTWYDGSFTVFSVRKDFGDFKEYGLLEYLTKHVSGKHLFPERIILLSYLLKNTDGVYVRDYSPHSPKVYVDLCGKDLFKKSLDSMANFFLKNDEIELINKQMTLGRKSTIPLQQYNGSYKVPEIWIPYAVPVKDISVEEEDFK